MECNRIRRLIDAHSDGELDLVSHLEIEEHLRVCPTCAKLAEDARSRQTVLRASLPRFVAPPQLASKIQEALRAEGAPGRRVVQTSRRSPLLWPIWSVTGLAASFAVTLFVGFAWGGAHVRANLVVDEAINDHVRSLQASHLTDVASTDQHTVKPWFAGKLDFAPPVVDLATVGFPLAGGRLEHVDGRPAAALVFHHRQHAINLFIWPAGSGAVSSRRSARNGYHTESWSQGGLSFLAISEIPATELGQFAAAFRAAVVP